MALHRCIFRIRPVKGRIFYASGLIILFSAILFLLVCAKYLAIVDNCVRLPAVFGQSY